MIPAAAIALVHRFEGCRLTPYLCPAGIPTIGWGHVIPSLDHPPITQAQADTWLEEDLARAVGAVVRLCPGVEGEGRLAALGDFVFNLGAGRLQTSTLRRRVNEGAWGEAQGELRRWVFARGRRLPGLVLRREAEARLLGGA